jgi:hypothetical protein
MSENASIDLLKAQPDEFALVIKGLPDARLSKRPDENSWCAKEIICHMRDTEELFLNRFQTILAIDEPKLLPPQPDRWSDERQYMRNDASEALAAFRKRREKTVQFLAKLSPDQWNRAGIHPKHGRLSMHSFVENMVKHGKDHLEQLQRALAVQP